jgi:hypothetical protein
MTTNTTHLEQSSRVDELAERIANSIDPKYRAQHRSPRRARKASVGIQVARVDRKLRREMREAQEKPHRAPPTRITEAEHRDELASYDDWDVYGYGRALQNGGVRGGLVLAGYIR